MFRTKCQEADVKLVSGAFVVEEDLVVLKDENPLPEHLNVDADDQFSEGEVVNEDDEEDEEEDEAEDMSPRVPNAVVRVLMGLPQRRVQPRTHICDLCGKGFHSKWKLERHIPTHEREKPVPSEKTLARRLKDVPRMKFECVHCGKWMPSNWKLQRHLNGHAKQEYRDELRLANAGAIHTMDCPECGMLFGNRLLLKAHYETEHEKTKVPKKELELEQEQEPSTSRTADVLPLTFVDPMLLLDEDEAEVKDAGKHSKAGRVECEKCGKEFPNKSKLKRHMGTHTKKK